VVEATFSDRRSVLAGDHRLYLRDRKSYKNNRWTLNFQGSLADDPFAWAHDCFTGAQPLCAKVHRFATPQVTLPADGFTPLEIVVAQAIAGAGTGLVPSCRKRRIFGSDAAAKAKKAVQRAQSHRRDAALAEASSWR
jgi:hypothetical protein